MARTSRIPPFMSSRRRRPAVGSLAGSLRGEIEQAAPVIAKLGEQKAAAVTNVRIIAAKLMAVVAKGQRLREVAGKWFEPAEVPNPSLVIEMAQADARRPAPIGETQPRLWEWRGLDGIEKPVAKRQYGRIGPVSLRLFHCLAIGLQLRWGSQWPNGPTNIGTAQTALSSIIAIMMGTAIARRSCAFPA